VDSPKGWTNQGNSTLRSNEWTPKADTVLSLIRPPRRAKAKRGGEFLSEAKKGGVNFCRSESQSLRAGGLACRRVSCASHLCERGGGLLLLWTSHEKSVIIVLVDFF
jgi:hypothetical protein